MEIEAWVLLFYFALWSIFYWFLSQYISSLSRDKWVEYVRSPDSDEMLLEALDPIIDKNIARTRAGILFADNRDPARQQQINKAKEADAKLKEAQATAQAAANQFGGLQLTRNV